MADIYFVPSHLWHDSYIELDSSLYRRFIKVMRMQTGDIVALTDGAGTYAEGKLDVKAKVINLTEISHHEDDRIPIDVYLPIIKGERMDWAIAKLGELGVRSITPVFTKRTVVKKWSDNKKARCMSILASSLEVRRRFWLTECKDARLFSDICGQIDIFFDIDGQRPTTWHGSISVLIGPEGGLTDDEKSKLLSSGATAISLGKGVLRAETAAIVGISIMAYVGGML